jgi:lysophospholipase L1-like esterase
MLGTAKLAVSLVVLPLGDSITDGVPTADGYRGTLAAQLSEAGVDVKYVGSLRSPAGRHEGWSGYTAAELLPKLRATLAQLHEDQVRPDVVLLHIGTNDLGLGVGIDQAVADVRALLVAIDEHSRAGRPGDRPTRVLLAQIIRRNLFGGSRDDEVDRFNARLAALAAERRKAGQTVALVDMASALDPRTDLDDALHPNPQGYLKMARAWARAVAAAVR